MRTGKYFIPRKKDGGKGKGDTAGRETRGVKIMSRLSKLLKNKFAMVHNLTQVFGAGDFHDQP
jgi:hypothetical protein